MMREDLVAERVAIDSYKEMVDYVGAQDPTKEIRARDEEHAEDLSSRACSMRCRPPRTSPGPPARSN